MTNVGDETITRLILGTGWKPGDPINDDAVRLWTSESQGAPKSGRSTPSSGGSQIQNKTDAQVIRDYFRAKFPNAQIASIDGGYAGGASEVLLDFDEAGLKRFVVYVTAGKVTSVKAVQ